MWINRRPVAYLLLYLLDPLINFISKIKKGGTAPLKSVLLTHL
jgi:hypothetical protein